MSILCENGITSAASDAVIVIFLALLTVGTIAATIVFLCKFAEDEGEGHTRIALAAILSVGFVLRLIFGLTVRGYRGDYKVFTDMFDHLSRFGLNGYYNGDASGVLYPVVYFIYLIFGGLSNVTGMTAAHPVAEQFMVKLPIILADLASAFCVYKISSAYFNKRVGLTLCAFVCVSPIFFVGSVIWTSAIAFTVMFLCFACYCLVKKRYAAMMGFSALAAFSSKEGIYLFPVFLIFSAFHFVRAILNIRRDAPKGKAVLSADYRAVIEVPVGFIVSTVGVYLLGLFMTASYSYNIFVYIYEFLLAPLVGWKNFTYNGLSIYSLFALSGDEPTARFPFGVFAALFAIIVTAIVCVIYFTKRNRATLVMIGAYIMLTMQVYYPGSTAVSSLSALILLAAAYALVKDKRILSVLFVFGLCHVINAASALAVPGYLNNLEEHFFGDGYTGSTLLEGGLSAIPITCSVFAVLSHLYMTVITVNVGMTGQKKMLNSCNGIGESFREYFIGKR